MPVKPRYVGTCDRLDPKDFDKVARTLQVDVAKVLAVNEVEARGRGFNRDCSPVMLPEFHIAYRMTSGRVRDKLVRNNLARKKWGQLKYPRTFAARYEVLDRMISIAGVHGFNFASYGLGQIMGFNHKYCGYNTAESLFDACRESEYLQLDAMAKFIISHGAMHRALINGDWAGFARRYNGPGYRKNRYDQKLKASYDRHRRAGGVVLRPKALDNGLLDLGDKGAAVVKLQKDLARLTNVGIIVDGDFGPMTEQAVKMIQRRYGLKQDGKVGPATQKQIDIAMRML